jgi:hypothetical protein
MQTNNLPATPETPKQPKWTEAKRNSPPRKERYFTFEEVSDKGNYRR